MEIPEITRLTNSNQHSNTASISIQHDRAIATSFVKYLLPISIRTPDLDKDNQGVMRI